MVHAGVADHADRIDILPARTRRVAKLLQKCVDRLAHAAGERVVPVLQDIICPLDHIRTVLRLRIAHAGGRRRRLLVQTQKIARDGRRSDIKRRKINLPRTGPHADNPVLEQERCHCAPVLLTHMVKPGRKRGVRLQAGKTRLRLQRLFQTAPSVRPIFTSIQLQRHLPQHRLQRFRRFCF